MVLDDGNLFLGGSGFTPSPVTSINGKDATLYLEQLGLLQGLQDPDAQWDYLMYSPARNAVGQGRGAFLSTDTVLGSVTTLGFANGTQSVYENFARINQDFTGVVDGATFYNTFLSGRGTTTVPQTNLTAPSPTRSTTTPTLTGYPEPVIVDSAGSIAGFFPTDAGLRDTAVLVIFTFAPEDQGGSVSIASQTVTTFLAMCKSAGKKNLVIDLTENPGGAIVLGDDIFKQVRIYKIFWRPY